MPQVCRPVQFVAVASLTQRRQLVRTGYSVYLMFYPCPGILSCVTKVLMFLSDFIFLLGFSLALSYLEVTETVLFYTSLCVDNQGLDNRLLFISLWFFYDRQLSRLSIALFVLYDSPNFSSVSWT